MEKIKKSKREELEDRALSYLKDYLSDMQQLQDFRNYADQAYMGMPIDTDGNELEELEGRSAVKMSDVADTVEWIMPVMMKIFYGGQKVVELRPIGRDDEVKARLMEEKVNFDFMRQNNGFVILHDWFKDCMLSKVAAVKYWWEEKTEKEETEFVGLTAQELMALQATGKFEVKQLKENMVAIESPMGAVEQTTFDVKGFKLKKTAKPCAEPMPPEEFVFDVGGRELNAESFCAHRKRVHKNYLKSKYKLSDEDLKGQEDKFAQYNSELLDQRFEDLCQKSFVVDSNDENHFYIYESYLPDYDDEGNVVPMKVVMFGDKAISVERNTYGKPPFCVLSAIRKPYRTVGLSLAELVMEIQKLRTALVRAILDNIYYQNNGIKVVNPYRIDIDDVIDHNHPGGIWRTQYDIDPARAIHHLQPQPLAPQTFNMLEWVETIKENRTGVTKYNQGLDSKSLNKTATGISQIMSASQQRMELIARIFAETGVKDLFQAFVDMNIKFFDEEISLKLNDEWQTVSPDMIDGKFDIIIDVGVGTGTNEVKVGQLINLLNVSAPFAQMGVVTPENIYNSLAQIYELMGYKNTDKYVTPPQMAQQQGPDPQQIAMQQEMQKQQMEAEAQMAAQQQEQQIEAAKAQMEIAILQEKLKGEQLANEKKAVDIQIAIRGARETEHSAANR